VDAAVPPRSWLDPRVAVGRSAIHGLGIFATEPVARGQVVEVLGGSTLTDDEVEAMIRRGERYDGISLGRGTNLLIAPADWPGIHGNHSCDPNLWMRDHVTVETRRDVPAGAELTIDYALQTASPRWSMACRCGSARCRTVVTGDDSRMPDLRARYGAHFSPAVWQPGPGYVPGTRWSSR
jgi:uncharacterized protein